MAIMTYLTRHMINMRDSGAAPHGHGANSVRSQFKRQQEPACVAFSVSRARQRPWVIKPTVALLPGREHIADLWPLAAFKPSHPLPPHKKSGRMRL